MAFSDFTYPEVLDQFGIGYQPPAPLFAQVSPLPPSPAVAALIRGASRLAIMVNTEKGRSEWMIAPLLYDVWERYNQQVGLYSGHPFPADPANGLTGQCDFLFSRSPQQTAVTPPAIVVVEAKNESIPGGLGQCVAEMVGAQRFNRDRGVVIDPLYGCVTNGSLWRFTRIGGNVFMMDDREYTLAEADRILGIFAHMLGPIPAAAAA